MRWLLGSHVCQDFDLCRPQNIFEVFFVPAACMTNFSFTHYEKIQYNLLFSTRRWLFARSSFLCVSSLLWWILALYNVTWALIWKILCVTWWSAQQPLGVDDVHCAKWRCKAVWVIRNQQTSRFELIFCCKPLVFHAQCMSSGKHSQPST